MSVDGKTGLYDSRQIQSDCQPENNIYSDEDEQRSHYAHYHLSLICDILREHGSPQQPPQADEGEHCDQPQTYQQAQRKKEADEGISRSAQKKESPQCQYCKEEHQLINGGTKEQKRRHCGKQQSRPHGGCGAIERGGQHIQRNQRQTAQSSKQECGKDSG